jgi:uncharacterized protein YggL (DUF469 family)
MSEPTFKSLDEAEARRICDVIWDEITQLNGEDAWSVLAIVLARFVDECGEDSREHFIKWLNHTRRTEH